MLTAKYFDCQELHYVLCFASLFVLGLVILYLAYFSY